MPLSFVPGQVAAGLIDGYLRDNPGDGTLGLPDYSLVPYAYAPLLGPVASSPQWYIDRYRSGAFAGFKGNGNGYGALRLTRGAASIAVLLQATGQKIPAPVGTRTPDSVWGSADVALAVRHSGTSTWSPAATMAYVALSQESNTIGMRLTTSSAQGPWDAEPADSAALTLPGAVSLWDGHAHTFALATLGQNVLCIVDEKIAFPFRAPRAYRHTPGGTPDIGIWNTLPATGDYCGVDFRSEQSSLYEWNALQNASGDFFLHDMGPTTVQAAPTDTYTPVRLPSGEAWSTAGTVTAGKDGILLNAGSSAFFTAAHPYGLICTRWGAVTGGGALVLRRVDPNNYYQVTPTGISSCVGGTLTQFAVFPTPIASGDHVVVRNRPRQIQVYVNGIQTASYTVDSHITGTGVGFTSPAGGTSQWRYIAHQPLVSDPVLPTS